MLWPKLQMQIRYKNTHRWRLCVCEKSEKPRWFWSSDCMRCGGDLRWHQPGHIPFPSSGKPNLSPGGVSSLSQRPVQRWPFSFVESDVIAAGLLSPHPQLQPPTTTE